MDAQKKTMKLVQVGLDNAPYPVYIGNGALKQRSLWQRHLASGPVLVISNEIVAPLYLDAVLAGIGERTVNQLVLPDGENHKSLITWKHILNTLAEMGATRDATVVALGGGVIGDISGFAAASYMRGIRLIQAPTTLLAQVDAAVGGKTAINLKQGKNLVGAFYQPAAVISDIDTLGSLPEREYRAGLAEVLKYGAIRDANYFHWLVGNNNPINARLNTCLIEMVERATAHKSVVVCNDEKESGERALLNFGHTFAHALETASHYSRYLHGEAVAIGMVMAARLSERIGVCAAGAADAISHALCEWGLPTTIPAQTDVKQLLELMRLDKKSQHDGIRLILLKALGEAVIYKDCPEEEILAVMSEASTA